MYRSTTSTQVVRAAGLWLAAVGGVALVLLGGQLVVMDDPGWALIAVVVLVGGVCAMLWSRAHLRELDAANKPFLLGEQGATVMRGREEFAKRLAIASHMVLAVFLVCGVAFIFLISAASCGERIDGYCGDVGRPSDHVMAMAQAVTLAMGALWIALMGLRRTQEAESDRIDGVVAEGQRRRRHDHPLAGTDRSSWE